MMTKQWLFWQALFLELIFFHYVRVSDISFSNAAHNLGVIFDSQLALREQMNKHCQLAYLRSGRLVHSDSIFLLMPPKLLLSPLLSPGFTTVFVMLFTLAKRFSFIKFKEWSTAQLASSAKLQNQPMSLLHSTISTGYQSAAEFNTNRSHLLPHGFCFLHTSLSCFISTPLFMLFAQSQIFHDPRMGRRTLGGEILSIH